MNFSSPLFGWWVTAAFAVVALAVYIRASQMQHQQLEHLLLRKGALNNELRALEEGNAALQAQILGQDSPAWIEQRLIARLGVIPLGAHKVLFLRPPPSQEAPYAAASSQLDLRAHLP